MPDHSPAARHPYRWVRWVLIGLGVAVIVIFFALAQRSIARQHREEAAIRKSVWVTAIKDAGVAPNFTLTDQRGQTISLDQFRGKAVVLEFFDPRCTDICPLVSQEIILAQRQLGSVGDNVVYLAVNVNEHHRKVSDVFAFSKARGLNKLPNFHFLTGTPAQLKAVWKAYGIAVVPSLDGDVQHSSVIYFIDPTGRERFLGHPVKEKASVPAWARAIAYYVRQTL